MAPRWIVLSVLFTLLAGSTLAVERTVTLVADKWCPFNCSDDPENRGILVERAAAALALSGIAVEYLEMPWSRAIIGVRDGLYDGIVGTGPTETPDFHFPEEPIAFARHSFFTLPSSSWQYRGLESLAGIRLGVIQDYSYGGLYEAYIRLHQSDRNRLVILRGNSVLPRLIRMLELGRIDALVAEEAVLDYHFAVRGRVNPLKYAGLADKEPLYIAFSPATTDGKALARALELGLKTLTPPP